MAATAMVMAVMTKITVATTTIMAMTMRIELSLMKERCLMMMCLQRKGMLLYNYGMGTHALQTVSPSSSFLHNSVAVVRNCL
jgi:hypothetical protein